MWRTMKLAAYALTATLALSGFALAQYGRDGDRDDDDHYRRDSGQAQQYGYQNGYNDGVGKGRHEGREHDPGDYQTPDWRRASHGYKDWMGSQEVYQRAYRDGYSRGFRAGYEEVADRGRNRDNGDRGYGQPTPPASPPAPSRRCRRRNVHIHLTGDST